MTERTVRLEEPGDRQVISDVEYAAFLNHPQHAPGAVPTEHEIVNRLRDAGALTLSLVAEEHGQIVAHIAFSPILIDGKEMEWYSLGPVAVRPDRQKMGFGSALINQGLDRMKQLGAVGIVLVGDPAYYCRFGFRSIPEVQVDGIPSEYVLTLRFGTAAQSGKVTFHKAFGLEH